MTYFKKALSISAALMLLTCGTAGKLPEQTACKASADQIRQFIASLSALTVPDEPFETLRYDTEEQQFYCDGIPVGQQYGGFSVHDGTVTVDAQSLGIESTAALTPEQAAEKAGITCSADADGLTLRAPFSSSRLILRCSGTPQNCENAESVTAYNDLHILQYNTPSEAYSAYQQYQADSRVSMVQPDQLYHVDTAEFSNASIPNSEKDLAVGYIGADAFCKQLLEIKDTLPEVTVAVLDTGLYAEHNWFQGRIADGSITMVNTDSDTSEDVFGHGTHCAGIIAQSTPDNVKILPVKVLSDRGYGFDSSIYCGMLYAVEQGADVVSMSLGGNGESWLLDEGIAKLKSADVPCIVAAGNETENAQYHHPARNPDCVTVSAVRPDLYDSGKIGFTRTTFSNYGADIDFCAPGQSIMSAYLNGPDSIEGMSGTSMATPFVAAAYADLLSYDPELSGDQIYACLKENAKDLGTAGFDAYFGWGMISLGGILSDDLPDSSVPAPEITKPDKVEINEGYYLNPPDTSGSSCLIEPDVPFVHNAYEYHFSLMQNARLILRTQSGKPVCGSIVNMMDYSGWDISDTTPADLELGTYVLRLDDEPALAYEDQEICTLHTEALSLYMTDVEAVDAFYTGSPVKPQVHVHLDGKLLEEGTDYRILPDTPLTEIGRYRLQIEGIGGYYDDRSFTFHILPAEKTDAPLLSEGDHTAEINTPGETVTYRWIPASEQYCFYWNNNRPGSIRIMDASGNLTATLSEIGEQSVIADVIPDTEYYVNVSLESPTLTGSIPFSVTADFRMLEDCKIIMPERLKAESGIPEYSIYDGKTRLTEGIDFEVFGVCGEQQYGLAEIIFRGIGKYHGMIERYYEICPASLNPLPENIPKAFDFTADQDVTAVRSFPGTMQLFRFAAPCDGIYQLILPDIDKTGISTFVYDADGKLLDPEKTEFTMQREEALQILCVTFTMASDFSKDDIFQLKVETLSDEISWQSSDVVYLMTTDGTVRIMDAYLLDTGGFRVPDTVIYPLSGEEVPVCDIDAALYERIADTHTFYVTKGSLMESVCTEYSLCTAAYTLTENIVGDLTGDGIVTKNDLLTLSRILTESYGMIIDEAVIYAADCNADGIVDMLDIRAMCDLISAAEQ